MKQGTGIRDFERYCDEILKKYKIPGFAIGLSKDGELCYEKEFGFRDIEAKLPLSPDTVFGVGSITKALTAVAILQLQEKGRLNVDDLVIKYLPEFKTPSEEQTKQMTIHHFLTHSSGLPPLATLMGAVKKSMEKDPKFEEDQQQENPLDAIQEIDTHSELMDAIANAEFTLLGAPGTEFSYSNDAYALLGAIIERISGIPYEQYVQENILEPAGMQHSVFQYKELQEYEDIAVLYDMRNKDNGDIIFRSNNPCDAPAMRAAGFLKSTVNDMLKFANMIRNDGEVGHIRVLSPESVASMTTPYIQCAHGTYYGYGLMITPDFFGYKLIQHGGDIKGVTAQMNILPELGLTGISLANLAGAPSSKLLFGACAGYLGKPIDESHLNVEVVDLAIESLKEYEGTFISGDGMKNVFYVEDGKLHLATAGLLDVVLKPIGDDQFLFTMRELDTTIRFVRDENKNIHRVEFAFRQIPKVEGKN
ncbi:serine hydrolase domain-containing protein [Salibacterium halotolerans]|uniref:CubicO group peptidase, beta-lactamase class C family n=1 Tax=Salibacterium halotolerans TaxID=1884432 RepID=A0A1I5L409_9BACI|nr:serine hydrolase domain-containing protein [Salibacterium halotolerans]SFO92024.1 CubicO group peptidase, beta-lactamase class C family [Salibacterium halotolerans]